MQLNSESVLFFAWSVFMKIVLNFLQNVQVNINNLEEYISMVVDATVKTGIMRQIEAFRAGFNQVIYLS